MKRAFSRIPGSETWAKIQPITTGWSSDEKFHIITQTGQQLLLRISDIADYVKEKAAYEAMRRLDQLDILTSQLIDSGLFDQEGKVFRIFTWLEGEEAIQVLPQMSQEQQYAFGLKAGRILRKIHQIPAPPNHRPWSSHFNQKIDRNIQRYHDCGIQMDHGEKIIQYLEQYRSLLEERPISFQHGDYHIGNMIITPEGELGIIDYNRLDFGDPWEEFNRIVWCAERSPWFASGRINGYFENGIPEDFFPLMKLYIGSNLIGSIPWALPFGQKEVDNMLELASNVLSWYDNFKKDKPNWYLPALE